MTDTHTTIRIWKRTLRKLRLIATLTGETIVATLDRLAEAEIDRLNARDVLERMSQPDQLDRPP